MGSVNFHIDKNAIVSEFQTKIGQLSQKSQDLVIEVANVFMLIAQVLAPYLTGGLRDSIQVFLGTLEARVESLLNYFEYVILGTPEHDIGSPVWIPQIPDWRYIGTSPAGRGKPHPGTRPNDFMKDAYDEGLAEAEDRINNFMEWLAE